MNFIILLATGYKLIPYKVSLTLSLLYWRPVRAFAVHNLSQLTFVTKGTRPLRCQSKSSRNNSVLLTLGPKATSLLVCHQLFIHISSEPCRDPAGSSGIQTWKINKAQCVRIYTYYHAPFTKSGLSLDESAFFSPRRERASSFIQRGWDL